MGSSFYILESMLPKTSLFVAVIFMLSVGCRQENRFQVAYFEDPVKVTLNRFDLAFIGMDTTDMICGLHTLEEQYPAFYPVFLSEALMMHANDSVENARQIKDFLQDSTFAFVHRQVKAVFEHAEPIEQELSLAYSYIHHYFPKLKLPELYCFVSGFNHQFIGNDSLLGIGTDLYLGADFALYHDITHEYLIPDMRKERICRDILELVIRRNFPFNGPENLLNNMIYEGKICFLISICMPDSDPETQIAYSKDAIEWCRTNEKRIWISMLEQQHLYSTDYMLINQYINPAPFTAPISQNSPGRLGRWVGWQIVQHYMQNNKTISLNDLMANENYQSILEQSHYRPR